MTHAESVIRFRWQLTCGLSLVLACGGGGKPGQSLIGGGGTSGQGGLGEAGTTGELKSNPEVDPGVGPDFPIGDGGSGGSTEPVVVEQNLIAFRLEPDNQVLKVQLGEAGTLDYHAYGRFASDPDTEVELTDRTVSTFPTTISSAVSPPMAATR